VYSNMISNQWSGAVILEDDAIIGCGFREFMARQRYRRWNMVFLAHGEAYAYRRPHQKLISGSAIYKLASNHSNCTTGYAINAEMAEKLHKCMMPIRFPADYWLCDLSAQNVGIAHPSIICYDLEGESTIGGEREEGHMGSVVNKKISRVTTLNYWKVKLTKRILWRKIPSSNKQII